MHRRPREELSNPCGWIVRELDLRRIVVRVGGHRRIRVPTNYERVF